MLTVGYKCTVLMHVLPSSHSGGPARQGCVLAVQQASRLQEELYRQLV